MSSDIVAKLGTVTGEAMLFRRTVVAAVFRPGYNTRRGCGFVLLNSMNRPAYLA